MPCLRFQVPGQPEETHPVSGPRVTIGRRAENTIQIVDRSVSAFHAELLAVNGHYRLRDLESTNRCFVRGAQVAEYHLRERCRLAFGSVEAEYDPMPGADPAPVVLSPAQMEQDLDFLRSENATLHERIRALQRQLDILGSAQLFRDKPAEPPLAAELEKTREELAIALRARDAARTAAGLLHSEKTSILREIRASGIQRQPLR